MRFEKGALIAEGKTKRVYEVKGDDQKAIIESKDDITAGDGARRDVIQGKGAISGRTTANVFLFLNKHGVATHFISAVDDRTMVVQRCKMIPLEVVVRRIATGSFLKRHPEVREGHRFQPVLVEFFLKDDARHDPLLSKSEVIKEGVASAAEVEEMENAARRIFLLLEQAWAQQDVTLVDLKVEFGRTASGKLVLADVIDNDSWRIWPHGRKEEMLDKQVYRNEKNIGEEGLARVKRNYEKVAEMTAKFINAKIV
ncbi:MAG: phosphoribosylaminoimidazolesuccinocarboxamide synthase [Candidatus Norongarragalinales archaeon]